MTKYDVVIEGVSVVQVVFLLLMSVMLMVTNPLNGPLTVREKSIPRMPPRLVEYVYKQ